MAKTPDTQLRAIYEKFNKIRDIQTEINSFSEQMSPREKRQLESAFRAINTNISYIKNEVKIVSKLLAKQGMRKSVKEIQSSFKKHIVEFGLDVKNVTQQHLGESFPASSLGNIKWSNSEAQKHSTDAVNKASKEIGRAQNRAVSIFTSDMKQGKYDNLDLSKSINTGRIKDSSLSKRDVLKNLYYNLRDRFNKYGKRKK
tara:strand:- start:146 stop:745 length:600 start_codon:yes stop_codon:yes gene_type:complete